MPIIVEFKKPEPRAPHMSGEAVCMACSHEWVAVAPVGSTLLECPNCRTEKGRMIYAGMPASGHIWKCACGCDLFRITTTQAICINCGNGQAF